MGRRARQGMSLGTYEHMGPFPHRASGGRGVRNGVGVDGRRGGVGWVGVASCGWWYSQVDGGGVGVCSTDVGVWGVEGWLTGDG